MKLNGRRILLCDCERTMSLDGEALAEALGADGTPRIHTNLCRRETAAFEQALAGEGSVLVACTQEAPLFGELAEEAGHGERVDFTNIRENAGWGEQGPAAQPKIAALLAAAAYASEPAPIHTARSEGVCLVYGPGQQALEVAKSLSGRLSVNLLVTDEDFIPPSVADVPIHKGRISRLTGSLGRFEVTVDGYAPLVPSSRAEPLFAMPRDGAKAPCDLVLDLSGGTPLVPAPDKRDGYFRADPDHPAAVARAMFEISDYVGTFEKPQYVAYSEEICAHSRSRKIGCRNCLDVCPAGALQSDGDRILLDHGTCAGCGSCSAVCPTGAISYRYPRRHDLVAKLQILLGTYARAGGLHPVVLFHEDGRGGELISAMARFGRGLPANVLPVPLFAVTELGHDILAATLAAGAERIVVLAGPERVEEMPPLEAQAGLAASFLSALGLEAETPRISLLVEADPFAVEEALFALSPAPQPAFRSFAAVGTKREIARSALSALHDAVTDAPERIELPAGAPYGRILVDTEGCTLCLSCVGACPTGAILDNPDRPQLRFQEAACVQCGLCKETCPESVISLQPRFDFTPQAQEQIVLYEEEPFECISCGKPFGTKKSIERVVERLAGHSMFRSEGQLDLIRMCDNCRVEAQYSVAGPAPMAFGERPRVRTTEDYLSERERDHANGSGGARKVDDFLS
ncbi:4Fe-4S binding protein [Lutibaculum baratangense]|uniref:Iron-sulfur cluster-binding protein n=1 Tax=Lutibaculum baratangense AMV1 TaxID=631454 RepID=V4T8L0_9HYPH|nr:4Fe-4S binding protein [Lutibaculum baratangense]ESR22878.1 Iron-sulfur cluster-binding protein [Lutibaculum baratangense AMV1]